MIEISSDIAAWVSIGIVLAMFALFITEIFPTEVVAISGVALMLVLGLLPYDMALNVLSNPAPWTIAGMFIVMGALVRTGALESFIAAAERTAKNNPYQALVALLLIVVGIGLCEQHTRRGRDDPCVYSIGENHGHSGQPPFDPAVLCGHYGRDIDPDWNINKPIGRRRRPYSRVRAVFNF